MSNVDKAVELYRNGCACSQAILAVYGKPYGVEKEMALRISAGFAAGMRMGETCGAITGAIMVLGMRHCGEGCETMPGRQNAYVAVNDFIARFKSRKGSTLCKDLISCDVGTPEGLQSAMEKGLFQTICPGIVQAAAEILEEMETG
jgi:C_GCAxxG_C_C family probable redox protein